MEIKKIEKSREAKRNLRRFKDKIQLWRDEVRCTKGSRLIGEGLLNLFNFAHETVIPLNGGLGNQVWMYAVGRGMQRLSGLRTLWTCSTYKKGKEGERPLELFSTFPNIKFIEASKFKEFIYRNFLRTPNIYSYKFDEKLISPQSPYYVQTFLGHKDYFLAAGSDLRAELEFSHHIQNGCAEVLSMIGDGSVGVHVRRGDYVNLPAYQVTTPEYFIKSAKIAAEKIFPKKPHFFFFSDGMDWVKQYIAPHIEWDMTFMEGMHDIGGPGDLYLFSKCENQIISNSSFSWLGAWLNENENKIVVAPAKWFSDSAPEKLKIDGQSAYAMPNWVICEV